ncbi:MAG: glycosyltransferase [Steroidobacteraceae bacterium]
MNREGRRPLAVLTRTFPKLSETFILEELLGLERSGVALTVFALQRPTDTVEQPAMKFLRAAVHYLDAPGWRQRIALHMGALLHNMSGYVRAIGFALARPHAGRLADFNVALKLARRLRSLGIGHLHAHFIDRPGDIAALAAMLAGIGFSLSAHAKDIYRSAPRALARKMRAARFTTTCTGYNHRELKAAAPDASVHRIYHAIDTTRFHCADRDCRHESVTVPHLLAVGRLKPKKGFATLVRACAELRARGLAFQCDIVGYGELRGDLAALIERLGLVEHVTLHGKLTHRELLPLYARARVFAMPCEIASDGDRDGIPNVLLEAMAMRLPVVASEVSGIPEVMTHGHNGSLVPPGDAVALADEIAALLRERHRAAALAAAARTTILQRFAPQRSTDELLALLPAAPDVNRADPAVERRYA